MFELVAWSLGLKNILCCVPNRFGVKMKKNSYIKAILITVILIAVSAVAISATISLDTPTRFPVDI
jgi:hypothetical protein